MYKVGDGYSVSMLIGELDRSFNWIKLIEKYFGLDIWRNVGKGVKRKYTLDQAYKFKVIKMMIDTGHSYEFIKENCNPLLDIYDFKKVACSFINPAIKLKICHLQKICDEINNYEPMKENTSITTTKRRNRTNTRT